MHSSRMRTTRSSSHPGGLHTPPGPGTTPGPGTPPGPEPPRYGTGDPPGQIPSTSPLGVDLNPPWPDPRQLPPWVWAWRPPTPDKIPLNFPPGCGPGNLQGMLGYHPLETCCKACWDTTPLPPCEQNRRRL